MKPLRIQPAKPRSLSPATDHKRPLADRLRPTTLDDYAGQEHILGPGKPLRAQIERDQLTSIILWGPPGVGKATLAHIVARTDKERIPALQRRPLRHQRKSRPSWSMPSSSTKLGRRTIVFIDEIHQLQQSPAGCLPPLRRTRRHHAHRSDHRKPVLRNQRRPPLPARASTCCGPSPPKKSSTSSAALSPSSTPPQPASNWKKSRQPRTATSAHPTTLSK